MTAIDWLLVVSSSYNHWLRHYSWIYIGIIWIRGTYLEQNAPGETFHREHFTFRLALFKIKYMYMIISM